MDNNDCRIAYTELASNGVVGYRPTTISSDDTAFAFRMPVEEHGGGDPSSQYMYSVPVGETVVFTCANDEEKLLYQNMPIRPDSTLNFFTWSCPLFDNNIQTRETLFELPLSCSNNNSGSGQVRRALRGSLSQTLN